MPEHFFLKGAVIRFAKWPPERKTDPESPGRLDPLGMFLDQTDLGGGDAFILQIMGKPADRARAVRSDRYQQDGIDLVIF